MTMLASQITSLMVVYSIVYLGVNQRKHQSSASLAFVREIHRGPVNFPHKWPVTRKMFPFDDVIMPRDRQHLPNITAPREHWMLAFDLKKAKMCKIIMVSWLWPLGRKYRGEWQSRGFQHFIRQKRFLQLLGCFEILSKVVSLPWSIQSFQTVVHVRNRFWTSVIWF